MHYFLVIIPLLAFNIDATTATLEFEGAPGWQVMLPTPGTHRASIVMEGTRRGIGCGKITGVCDENNARGGFLADRRGGTAIPPGKTYRLTVAYRTSAELSRHASVNVQSYTRDRKSQSLLGQKLTPSQEWTVFSNLVQVPEDAERIRITLYLYGKGTVWFDDVFFGETTDDAPNLLRNGGFEPPLCHVYDLAPERPSGNIKLFTDFENAALGKVKQIGPDEFYLYATPEKEPRSPFLWFHYGLAGGAGREITFHMNMAPFSAEQTSGNGNRIPVVSDDGDTWTGIDDKAWNEDGSCLTFKHRFTRSPAWVCSFFPFTPAHVTRFIAGREENPYFSAGTLGKTREERDLRYYTITDPSIPEADKRTFLFIALQHDLETTGALVLEGICRYLLSEDPGAAKLRQSFVTYVVPMMNPDGIAGGNLYCPVGNMNRQWGLGTVPEVELVERFARDLATRDRKIEIFMDFHGWCTPTRSTIFMTFGKELTDEGAEKDSLRLSNTVRKRVKGKLNDTVWRQMDSYVTSSMTDLHRMASGWMRFEAGARLAFTIEIFGDGNCSQDDYYDWGRAFAEAILEFYGS
ncbi:MAG: hypothetical protein GXY44_06285 [Phycisphaerales bacterium]|nr:hypothetical protein [Phycisphaerales bacterium]